MNKLKILAKAFFSSNEEFWKSGFQEEFNNAKAISDFAGMLIRLSSLMLAVLYFKSKITLAKDMFFRYAFTASEIVCCMLYLALTAQIGKILLYYFLSDLPKWRSPLAQCLIVILALSIMFLFNVGIYVLANDIAQSNILNKSGPIPVNQTSNK